MRTLAIITLIAATTLTACAPSFRGSHSGSARITPNPSVHNPTGVPQRTTGGAATAPISVILSTNLQNLTLQDMQVTFSASQIFSQQLTVTYASTSTGDARDYWHISAQCVDNQCQQGVILIKIVTHETGVATLFAQQGLLLNLVGTPSLLRDEEFDVDIDGTLADVIGYFSSAS